MVVLSQEHLLTAQDDVTYTRASHGIIARYCPRNRLRRAALEHTQGDLWLNVTVGLHDTEETLRLLFEPAAEPALQGLISAMF